MKISDWGFFSVSSRMRLPLPLGESLKLELRSGTAREVQKGN